MIYEKPIMGNLIKKIQFGVEYSVQSGNKKFDRIYKVVTLLDGNILQFGTLQFGNRNAKIKK